MRFHPKIDVSRWTLALRFSSVFAHMIPRSLSVSAWSILRCAHDVNMFLYGRASLLFSQRSPVRKGRGLPLDGPVIVQDVPDRGLLHEKPPAGA